MYEEVMDDVIISVCSIFYFFTVIAARVKSSLPLFTVVVLQGGSGRLLLPLFREVDHKRTTNYFTILFFYQNGLWIWE